MSKIVEKEIGRASDGKPIILRTDPRKEISRENRATWKNEKRMKELAKRGYSIGEISGMMFSKRGEFRAKEIEKAIRNPHIKTDGEL